LAGQLWDGEIMPIEPVIDNKAKGTFAQREALLGFIHENMIGYIFRRELELAKGRRRIR